MSDIGLFPPGGLIWLGAIALLPMFGVGLVVSLGVAWFRTRKVPRRMETEPFFGYAIGAAAAALGAGCSIWMIGSVSSLGPYAHLVDQPVVGWIWLFALVLLWPAVALAYNRATARRA